MKKQAKNTKSVLIETPESTLAINRIAYVTQMIARRKLDISRNEALIIEHEAEIEILKKLI